MTSTPNISIVLPVYNEVENIEIIAGELGKVLQSIGKTYEVIFSDDGSSDGTFQIIKALNAKDERIKGISLSKNFGHQTALHAGLKESGGELVITMDGDMQHPPSLIPEMISKYEEGHDIVNTRRLDTAKTAFFKRMTSRWYYKLINALSDVPIEPASADFRLMHRKAVDAMIEMPERQRFTRGLVGWMGFDQVIIDYEVGERYAGSTKFTFWKMLRLGLDGVVSFSVKPLRIAFYIGTVISLLALLYGVYAIVNFISGETVPGWTSILVSVLFIGGFTLLSLGIIGDYIARIYNEVRRRPMYFIKERTSDQ